MANTFTASIPQYWSKKLQEEYYVRNVFKYITNTRFQAELSDGDTFNFQYDDSYDNDLPVYTVSTDMAVEDITTTNETLSINKKFGRVRSFDKFNLVQVKPDVVARAAVNDAMKLSNQMDSDVLYEAVNATLDLDDSDFSGTSGNSIDPTTSNILEIFTKAGRELDQANVEDMNRWAVISPKVAEIITQHKAGRDTNVGDSTTLDGNMGMSFAGFNLYKSNNLTCKAVLALATDPSNTNTIVIDGITFTAVTSIGSTAGNFLVGSSADQSRANLTALINDPGTTNSNQVGWATTHANYKKLKNRATAVNDNSANTMTLTYKGRSNLVVSETLTDATDEWTTAKKSTLNLFGCGRPIDLVTQIEPMVEVSDIPLQFGQYVKRGMLYGIKTFADGATRLVEVNSRT